MPDTTLQRKLRVRVAVFLTCAVLFVAGVWTLYAISNTLTRLDAVEAERDKWQRSTQVLRNLEIKQGSTVADLGCGAGYFTLKLAPAVGASGKVVAVDLRRLSLFFLRIRALMRHFRNIEIVVGSAGDPYLPAERFDAVLISNTYHEFANPDAMLEHTRRALRHGGRLVIIDRGPAASDRVLEFGSASAAGHEMARSPVEAELRGKGFEIVSRDDDFATPPGDEPWWLLVARRP